VPEEDLPSPHPPRRSYRTAAGSVMKLFGLVQEGDAPKAALATPVPAELFLDRRPVCAASSEAAEILSGF